MNFKSPIFFRYVFFGGLNTLITFIIYIFLIKLRINYLIASTLIYIIGILEGFLLNCWFVFKEVPKIKNLSKYTLVYVIAYVLNIFLLYNLVDFLNVQKITAQLIAIIIVTVINFKLVRLVVF